MPRKTLLVTGGAGFIGSNFVRFILKELNNVRIINLDALTYAGNPLNFSVFTNEMIERHRFVHGDINDVEIINRLFYEEEIEGVIHFAAESHVDRSILGPAAFIETNIKGTFNLLEASLKYWEKKNRPEEFRFIHISTDEVYGSLGSEGFFTEETPYNPSSPYSASKASSDHLVKAYYRTYGFPTIITNCSNNYGPYQFPEKLIPLMILNIVDNASLPVYGDGKNVRDWLYVIDHCEAVLKVLEEGNPGETYNIGGNSEYQNIEIVHMLCDILDQKLNRNSSSRKFIKFVKDRLGHDRRYAIDASKIKYELGWTPKHTFENAIEKTIDWYLANMNWIDKVKSGVYQEWIIQQYGEEGK